MKKIKTITSYAGLARWNAEVDDEPIGYLARVQVKDIPSPYMYSPTKLVWNWNGRAVVQFETSHKRYEVYEVPATMLRFQTDDEAMAYNTRFSSMP